MKFRFQRKYLALPYLAFLLLFVVLPIILIVYYAFSDSTGRLSIWPLQNFFSDTDKLEVLVISLIFGFINTVLCLLIGYPVSMLLANKKYNKNIVLVMLFIMPMWINFVIRTWATRDLLAWMDLSGGKYPELATIIGLVYNYLPFAIMPLYTTMLKMDKSQIEAASDLGANPVQVFFKVIIPMTKPGVLSATTMVFMPTISSYVIADILGEGKVTLFGKYIELYYKSDWNNGSFLALIMLVLIGVTSLVSRKFTREDNTQVRSSIW